MIPNPSNTPAPASIDTRFYGPPVSQEKKRKGYKHQFGETISLSDGVVYEANVRHLTRAYCQSSPYLIPVDVAVESAKREIEKNKTFETIVLVDTRAERDEWLNPVTLVNKYTSVIQEHLVRRVDNFLLQLVGGCFGSRLHFEIGKTQAQGESAPALKVDYRGTLTPVCVRNAAHSSTFPCLIAYRQTDWENYQRGLCVKPVGIDFLKDSDQYKGMNSTIAMPASVNQADIEVDGSHHDSFFSVRALALINQSSQGQITLKEAMKQFLDSLKQMIEVRIPLTGDKPGVQQALWIYQATINELIAIYRNDPEEWIFTQMNLMVDAKSKTSELKGAMLKLRSEAIQRNMRGQAEIMWKVNQVSSAVLKMIKGTRAPDHYEEAFKALVIENMHTDADRSRVQCLFSLNSKQTVGKLRKNLEKTKNKISSVFLALNSIKTLCKTISCDMRTMNNEEIGHRGDSMRLLRRSKGWTQKELGQALKQRYPFQFSSQSTMCRTERGQRFMDEDMATQLSETFEVPRELLLPQFFYV